MFIKRYLHDIQIAVEAIIANRVKSILTALGIIFGVAAGISMLAIGNGAEQEILEQIKLVGVNNIVITPSTFSVNENASSDNSEANGKPGGKKFSKGLTLLDVKAIKQVLPTMNWESAAPTTKYLFRWKPCSCVLKIVRCCAPMKLQKPTNALAVVEWL